MKTVQFLSNSIQIDKITKGLNLTRSLFVSSLLMGEEHTGKKTLIKMLFPDSTYVDALQEEELTTALQNNNELIIYNFEQIKNIESLNFEHKRIIAIANSTKNKERLSHFFAFIYEMPNLQNREDVNKLIDYFYKQSAETLMIDEPIKLDKKKLDLSHNIKSLKASICKQLLLKSLQKEEIKTLLYDYLHEELEGNNAYRTHLRLFEEPLLKAGLSKYKSQLKLAGVLGLNRNTLRKKLQEYDIN